MIDEILIKAQKQHCLSREEIISLLENASEQQKLLSAADAVRKEFVGDEVHLRGLIEFSNICRNNCLYCGIRKDNTKVRRYRLREDEIIALAEKACAYGFKTIVMQSGEDLYYTAEKMDYIIRRIKALGVAITLSMGEKSYAEYAAYREAGADRYLLRIETTDKDLYHHLDPQMSWENRRRCLEDLRRLDYEVGSGIMVGLPGQSVVSIAEDLLFLQEIGIDMAGIGPFIPHPDTPLRDAQGRAFDLALRTMAVMRLLLPDINIPATTAMEALNPQGRIVALQSGANVVMPNVTEGEGRQLYVLYPGKVGTDDTPLLSRLKIGEKIVAIGRTIAQDGGRSRHHRLYSPKDN